MEYYLNVLYYVNIYKRLLKAIIYIVPITMVFTVIFSLLVPSKYISTVTIISVDSAATGGTSSIGNFLGISNILGGGASSVEIMGVILSSKRMTKDIRAFLEINKNPKFRYSLSTGAITGGLAVDVVGDDPVFTEKVANFAVQNLDKINSELNITPKKPMAKVLDPADYGIRQSRQIPRKTAVAGFAAFLLISFYAFFCDYIKRIKTLSNP